MSTAYPGRAASRSAPLTLLALLTPLALASPSAFRAAAQPPPAADPPMRPPEPLEELSAPYPAGAEGTGTVVLELLVDVEGRISNATVVEGVTPFAEQALQAAAAWRFSPALRGQAPVPARIRVRVDFRPPAPPEHSAPPVPLAPAARPTPGGEDAVQALEEPPAFGATAQVRASIPDQTAVSIEEVRVVPGALGDPFRVVEALPSVTPTASGLPYFFVRGAPPNNNAYFLDGVRVPLLFHLALGPGVIHPGLFEHVELHPGAAPARYGGVAGAIVAGTTRPAGPVMRGEANVRVFDAGALVEVPLADGQGTALVASRYGYPGPIVGAFSDVHLDYWDYQGRFTWRIGEHGRTSLLAFGSHDLLAHDDSGTRVEDLASDFHRLDLRYDYATSTRRLRMGVTLGHDVQGSQPTYMSDRSLALRIEAAYQLNDTLRVDCGATGALDGYGLRQGEPLRPGEAVVPASADPPPTNLVVGAYGSVAWRPWAPLELIPGVRVDGYFSRRPGMNGERSARTSLPAVEPRLSARVRLSPWLALTTNAGVAHQLPSLRVGGLPVPVASVPGFPLGHRQLQQRIVVSQGVEVTLPAEVSLELTGFAARTTGLTDLTAFCTQIEPPTAPAGEGPPDLGPYFCPSDRPIRGHSYGLELMLRRSFSERLSGWIAYTLSRSVRHTRFLTLDGTTQSAVVPSDYDRTHVLNLVLSYALGSGWRAGGRLVAFSGAPYSTLSGNLPVPPYNNRRDPPFARLDVRIEKRWSLGSGAFIALVLEGQNVTLSTQPDPLGLDCDGQVRDDTATTECSRPSLGPITIPSIGVEAAF